MIYVIYVIYLANGLHKAKIKLTISDTVFYAWRNHQGEVVVVAGVYLFLFIYCLFMSSLVTTCVFMRLDVFISKIYISQNTLSIKILIDSYLS